MALNPPKLLVSGNLIDATNETLYTVGPNLNTLITQATLHNTSASARVVTVWVGASAVDATQRFKRTVLAYDTVDIDGVVGTMIPAASLIIAVCDTASAVSISVSGTEFATP